MKNTPKNPFTTPGVALATLAKNAANSNAVAKALADAITTRPAATWMCKAHTRRMRAALLRAALPLALFCAVARTVDPSGGVAGGGNADRAARAETFSSRTTASAARLPTVYHDRFVGSSFLRPRCHETQVDMILSSRRLECLHLTASPAPRLLFAPGCCAQPRPHAAGKPCERQACSTQRAHRQAALDF